MKCPARVKPTTYAMSKPKTFLLLQAPQNKVLQKELIYHLMSWILLQGKLAYLFL